MVFSTVRFIQAVVVIGNNEEDYAHTKDFTLFYLNDQSLEIRAADYFSEPSRRFGKEMQIQQFGKGIVFRKNVAKLGFKYIGVFTTITNCSLNPTFSWTENPIPYRIPVGSLNQIEINAKANEGDCPLSHYLLKGGIIVSNQFLKYDDVQKKVQIAPNSKDYVGLHQISVNASLVDGYMEPITQSKSYTFEVFTSSILTLNPASAYSMKKQGNYGFPVSFDLPTFLPTPPDALLDIEYTLNGAPPIISILDNKKLLISDATATQQTISVQLTATDKFSGLKTDLNFLLEILSCKPKNLSFGSTIITVYTMDLKKEVKLKFDPVSPECGTYELTTASVNQYIKISTEKQVTVEISALYGALTGTFSELFSLKNANSASFNANATLVFKIVSCIDSVLLETINNQTFNYGAAASTIQVLLKQDQPYCKQAISYTLQSYDGTPLPAWITLLSTDNSKIIVNGTSKTDIGTKKFKIRALGAQTGYSDLQTFDITIIDCIIKNFQATPSSITISQLGPPQSIQASNDSMISQCYSLIQRYVAAPTKSKLIITPNTINQDAFTVQVSASLDQPIATTSIELFIEINNMPSLTEKIKIDIQVTSCKVISLSQLLSQSNTFYLIGSNTKNISLPVFIQTPDCQQALTYQATSQSSIFSFDQLTNKISLFGSDLKQAGTFTIQFKGKTSFDIFEQTHTILFEALDCTPTEMIAIPDSVSVSQLGGTSQPIVFSTKQPKAECGTYLYSTSQLSFIQNNSNSFTVTAGLSDKVGSYQVQVKKTNSLVPLTAQIFVPVIITPCVVEMMKNLNTIIPNLPSQFIIGGPAIPIDTMPIYSQTPDCKYKVLFKDTNQNFELIQKEEKWFISTKASIFRGLNSIKLTAYFNETQITDVVQSFYINCIKIQCSPLLDLNYLISQTGSTRRTVSMVEQQSLLVSPEITLSQLQFKILQMGNLPLPNWIIFDPQKAEFSIQVQDQAQVGDYFFQIQITANEIHSGWSWKQESWKVSLKYDNSVNRSIPVINKLVLRPPVIDQEIRPGDNWSYQIPQAVFLIEDETTKAKKINLVVKSSKTIIQISSNQNKLILSKTYEKEDKEDFVTVTYKLTEADGLLTAEITQMIKFMAITIEQPTNSTDSNNSTLTQSQNLQTKAILDSNPFAPFNPWLLFKQNEKSNSKSQQQTQKKSRPLSIGLKSISQTGIINIQFSEPVVVPLEYVQKGKFNTTKALNSTATDVRILRSLENALQVRIIPGQESNEKNLTYTWSVQEFTELNMQIKVSFTNAKYVSVFEDLDKVQVIFFDPDVIIAQSGSRIDQPISFQQPLPRQMDPDSPVAVIAQAANQGATGVKTFVIGNIVMSTVLSASLNQLFSMVEAQQLVCLITCSLISLPPLPAVFISQFFQIANFDIMPVGQLYEKIFYMPTLPSLNANFAAVGFNDTYFINNLGSILLSIIGFLALQSFATLSKKLKKKSNYFKAKWIDLQQLCFWNMPIRVILSSYSMISLSALMTLQNPQWKLPGPIIDTLVSFMGLIVTIIFPGLVLYIMLQNFKDFDTRHFKASFGSLYEGLNSQNKWIIAFRVWFILRRLIISFIVVYAKNLIAQIVLWFFQEIISIIILGYGYPFEHYQEWKTEMYNEVFILSTIYFTMFFSPYIQNVDVLNGIGYCFCGLLFAHLIINIIFIGIVTIRQKLKEFKQWRIIRREKLRMINYRKLNFKKKQNLSKNITFRRRSEKEGHNDLNDELDGKQRYSIFQKNELLNRNEQRGLMIPQLLVNPKHAINKSRIVLEQIQESSESSSSCSSQRCDSENISYSEEVNLEDTYQIEEQGVGIQPVPKVAKNDSLLDLKIKEINELVMAQKINQEEVFSEQTDDGQILQLIVSEQNQTPFKLLNYDTSKEEEKGETILQIKPKNKSPINLEKSTIDFKKQASIDQIIKDLEQHHNSRYDKTLDEEEFLRELSETYIDDPDANRDSIDELAQLQKNIDLISLRLSSKKNYENSLSNNSQLKGNYYDFKQKSTIIDNRKSQNNSPYREKLIRPNQGFSLNRSVEQMTKPLKLKPETNQLFKQSSYEMEIQQEQPETKMLQEAVRKFTSMHQQSKLSKSRDEQIFSKSLKPQNPYRFKKNDIIVLENSDYQEPSQMSVRDI